MLKCGGVHQHVSVVIMLACCHYNLAQSTTVSNKSSQSLHNKQVQGHLIVGLFVFKIPCAVKSHSSSEAEHANDTFYHAILIWNYKCVFSPTQALLTQKTS